MYAWDIIFSSSTGNGHHERVSAFIRRDSNANGVADSGDAVVSGATVTVELRNSSGTLIGTFTGTTDSTGRFRTSRTGSLASGTYWAEVTVLSHATYTWNKALDPTSQDTDLGWNSTPNDFPDQSHAIPH